MVLPVMETAEGDWVAGSGVAAGSGTGAASTGPAVPPLPSNLLRPAGLRGPSSWTCAFPPEADADAIDFAEVKLIVQVNAAGQATKVSILVDPGHGFGRAARTCALARQYSPALDASGNAIDGVTPVFTVRFAR